MIDFGRVVTGWFAAVFVPHNNPAGEDEEVPLPAGTEVTMEYLDHRDAKPPFTETDIYISDGKGRDIFRNRFHMHSFCYVRIKGAGLIYARALQISAVDPDGGATFECFVANKSLEVNNRGVAILCLVFFILFFGSTAAFADVFQ